MCPRLKGFYSHYRSRTRENHKHNNLITHTAFLLCSSLLPTSLNCLWSCSNGHSATANCLQLAIVYLLRQSLSKDIYIYIYICIYVYTMFTLTYEKIPCETMWHLVLFPVTHRCGIYCIMKALRCICLANKETSSKLLYAKERTLLKSFTTLCEWRKIAMRAVLYILEPPKFDSSTIGSKSRRPLRG